MNSFIAKSDFFKGNNPEDIVKKYGSPVYVYNEEILRDRMNKVSKVITGYEYHANYSIKANSNISILRIALSEGLYADAMSVGEMKMLIKAGYPSEKIFFIPNNVSEEEMRFAIDHNICVSLDSLSQLETFGSINKGGKCAVRINPGVGAGHHEKVVTAGKKTKFGVAEEDIDKIFDIAKKYDLKIVGINQHVGSLFMDPEPFLMAVDNFLRIAVRFENLEFIDFGGGYGIPYHKLDDEQDFPMEDFKAEFEKKIEAFVKDYGYAPVFKTEPGRFNVAESCLILGRVHATKQNNGVSYVGTDVGMNVLVRPSMYDSWHDIEVIRDGKIVDRKDMKKQTVVGNICESGDILAKDRELPEINKGDLVAVMDSGAYGYSMCSSYNTRPRPAEVLIDRSGEVRCIRRAETFEDIFRLFPDED